MSELKQRTKNARNQAPREMLIIVLSRLWRLKPDHSIRLEPVGRLVPGRSAYNTGYHQSTEHREWQVYTIFRGSTHQYAYE